MNENGYPHTPFIDFLLAEDPVLFLDTFETPATRRFAPAPISDQGLLWLPTPALTPPMSSLSSTTSTIYDCAPPGTVNPSHLRFANPSVAPYPAPDFSSSRNRPNAVIRGAPTGQYAEPLLLPAGFATTSGSQGVRYHGVDLRSETTGTDSEDDSLPTPSKKPRAPALFPPVEIKLPSPKTSSLQAPPPKSQLTPQPVQAAERIVAEVKKEVPTKKAKRPTRSAPSRPKVDSRSTPPSTSKRKRGRTIQPLTPRSPSHRLIEELIKEEDMEVLNRSIAHSRKRRSLPTRSTPYPSFTPTPPPPPSSKPTPDSTPTNTKRSGSSSSGSHYDMDFAPPSPSDAGNDDRYEGESEISVEIKPVIKKAKAGKAKRAESGTGRNMDRRRPQNVTNASHYRRKQNIIIARQEYLFIMVEAAGNEGWSKKSVRLIEEETDSILQLMKDLDGKSGKSYRKLRNKMDRYREVREL